MPTRFDALNRIHALNSKFMSMPLAACMVCLMPAPNIPKQNNQDANNSSNFLLRYSQLYLCLLQTLVPKHDDKSMVRSYTIDLTSMAKAVYDSFEFGTVLPPIDVANFLWHEV